MPVNYLHSLLHRVERGWDPIPRSYAEQYAAFAGAETRPALVDRIEAQLGGLAGKRVLDLGGGPGQYSVLFALRGADVTWHDISREYEAIARARAQAAGVALSFSLGYLEAAERFQREPFDLVFCRVCWYYARSDNAFARLLYSLVKPGGVGYIECNTPAFAKPAGVRKLQYWINAHLWWKIGHPMPPRGRIARLMQGFPVSHLTLNYASELVDIVTFVKPA
jgi:2-polyprenyl-3-methyl-5-hydroxy-6-metoxy-1,4-benzoquinol methylase